ncbi:MAG: ester cyclase [Reichenbachiella sp.]|uniref:ester cyclase n=1 Tax=Reichenbachiella sp. TaxID=2184521 RepID=UPI003264E90A
MIYTETKEYRLNGENQELPGFDQKYSNIVDYILKITEEIWEQRAIWVIYDTYAKDLVVHAGGLDIQGVEEVVKSTLLTLSSFPDRKMLGEAVIWSEEFGDAFYSSHRILSHATNTGKTAHGTATGKRVEFRTIADCVIKSNMIIEEWLVRDNLHLIEQLGFDPVEEAKKDNRYEAIKPVDVSPSKLGDLDSESPANLIQQLFQRVYSDRTISDIGAFYHTDAVIHGIRNKDYNASNFERHLFEILSCFTKEKVILERITVNKKNGEHELAARWVLKAQHARGGFFGIPSGKQIILRGINHYIVKDSRIIEEWMLFDGYDVLCQINNERS